MTKSNNIPTVSVIIPTYNRAQLIGRAIQSVLDQSYQDFEIIIVDDGSTDNTRKVLNGFKDKRIRYITHKENKGYPSALNTGLGSAKGEYIAFQDDDDEWLPKKLEKQMKIFEESAPNIGVVYTGFWRVEGQKKMYIPFSWVRQKEGNVHNELLKGNFVGTPASIVKKECFNKIGQFDTAIRNLQDWELWIRISKYYEFRYVSEPLLISHHTSNGVNQQPPTNQAETMKLILEKHIDEFSKEKKILAKHYLGIGSNLYRGGEIKEGINYFIKSIEIDPLNINHLLIVILSLLFGRNVFSKLVNIYQHTNLHVSHKAC